MDKTVRVYPSPKLPPLTSVKGVGAGGADVTEEQAEALMASGLVVKTKPKESAEPAEKSEKPE